MTLKSIVRIVAVIIVGLFGALGMLTGAIEAKKYFGFKPMIVSICHYHELDNIKLFQKSETPSACETAPVDLKKSDYSGVLRFDLMNPNSNELTLDYLSISNVALCDIKAYGISGKTMPFSESLVATEDRANGIVYLNPPGGVRILPNDGLHLDLYVARNSPSEDARIDPHISSKSRISIRDAKAEDGEPLISSLDDLIEQRYDGIRGLYWWKAVIFASIAMVFVTAAVVLSQTLKEKEKA